MLRAKKSLGQNWLRDGRQIEKIVRALGDLDGASVVEIGPGTGMLTAELLKSNLRELVAVELDPRCAEVLTERFGGDPRFRLEMGDCREINLPPPCRGVALLRPVLREGSSVGPSGSPAAATPHQSAIGGLTPPQGGSGEMSWLLVGNLPYYLSGTFLRRVGALADPPARAAFLLQREVVEKVTAPRSEGGKLGVWLGNTFHARDAGTVPARAFTPAPRVTSGILALVRRDAPVIADLPRLSALLDASFAARRKTLGNNLRALPGGAAALASSGIDPGRRAETLEIAEWAALVASESGPA